MQSKEKLAEIKLSASEVEELNNFIGTSVRKNHTFTLLTDKVAVSPQKSVQELYHSSIAVLTKYGELLKAETVRNAGHDFDPLSTGKTEYTTPGNNDVPATKMLKQLVLMIREKTYIRGVEERKQELKEAREELEALATPEEKKEALRRKIEALS